MKTFSEIRTRSNLRRVVAAFGLLLLITLVQAQRRERAVDSWKPLHYNVSLTLNDQLSEISWARTEIIVTILKGGVGSIDLDFGSMPIDSVTVEGNPARFERQPDILRVFLPRLSRLGEKLSLAVFYHGRPEDGLIFSTDRDGKPSVAGDNWPNRVHHWIPSLDHPSAKATVTFRVDAPTRALVVANGKPSTLAPYPSPSIRTFEETKPIPAYCMVIAVNEGAKIDAPEKTVTPLSFYVPRVDSAYAPKGFSSADEALEFFSETIGPYPYDKLALIVSATRFGGMENSSAIVFTNTLFDLQANEKMSTRFGIPARIESVVAHEIAHQWFGDSVTESTWADLWLSEGFATYFAALFIQKYDGEVSFREYMRDAATRYFDYERERNAPIHDTETVDLMKLLNANNYEKGAWVLHMLRARLGDEKFFQGLRNYYQQHREANATTEDLRRALEAASGKDLRGFFARWIYGAGHPVYQTSIGPLMRKRHPPGYVITIQQTQPGPVFTDPITVRMSNGNYTEMTTIVPTKRTASVTFLHAQRPTSIEIDPDNKLLKEVVQK